MVLLLGKCTDGKTKKMEEERMKKNAENVEVINRLGVCKYY